jgi:hypothetical protein
MRWDAVVGLTGLLVGCQSLLNVKQRGMKD